MKARISIGIARARCSCAASWGCLDSPLGPGPEPTWRVIDAVVRRGSNIHERHDLISWCMRNEVHSHREVR